ncbi:MAG: hypothetical protein LM554_00870 [Desulfurococcaceae archaeon]|nr:hypothetical protein [Desulfurococcaceae archaeon]
MIKTPRLRAEGLNASLLVLMILTATATPLLISALTSRPVSTGLLVVRAGVGVGSRGCVILALSDRELVLDGKRLSGNVMVSFGGEFHTIPVSRLATSGGFRVCFEKGYLRELERVIELYTGLGVAVDASGRAVGVSGREVVRRLVGRGVAGYALPAVSITLWLYDDEGYDYIYSEPISSLHYYLSKGYEYLDAFEKAFEDPLAVAREGVTITIPSIKELSRYLARVDKRTALDSVFRELGLLNKTMEVALESTTTASTERVEIGVTTMPGASGVIPNYWGYPTSPDQFWRARVSTRVPGSEVYVENKTWENFIAIYGSAYLFSKSMFSSPSAVRDYLNNVPGDTYGCFREGFKEMTSVLNLCLLSPSYSITWNHTMQPGATIDAYKPFVIQVISALQNPPSLILNLVIGSAQAGYNAHGWAFLGVLVGAVPKYWVITSVESAILLIPGHWLEGIRYVAISAPTQMRFYHDVLVLTYDIRQYWGDPNYWVAIPIATIVPYYIEELEYFPDYWDISKFDISGNCVAGTCRVSNINSLIREWSGVYSAYNQLYYHQLIQTTHDRVPTYDTTIDVIRGNATTVGGSCASVLLGVSLGLLSILLQVIIPAPVGTAASILLTLIATFIGYADQTLYGSASEVRLYWRRSPTASPQPSVNIRVEKLTQTRSASNLLNIVGKPPLVVVYRVVIY